MLCEFYLHWALYQEYLNIRNLNNLFALTELFPTLDLLDWRIPIYIYMYIHTYAHTSKWIGPKGDLFFNSFFLNVFPFFFQLLQEFIMVDGDVAFDLYKVVALFNSRIYVWGFSDNINCRSLQLLFVFLFFLFLWIMWVCVCVCVCTCSCPCKDTYFRVFCFSLITFLPP